MRPTHVVAGVLLCLAIHAGDAGAAPTATTTKSFEAKAIDTEFVAVKSGFVVVRLQANPSNRAVAADGYIDGEIVASASAAHNAGDKVISSATQTFTMPVPRGAKWMVKVVTGGGVEVRWFPH